MEAGRNERLSTHVMLVPNRKKGSASCILDDRAVCARNVSPHPFL